MQVNQLIDQQINSLKVTGVWKEGCPFSPDRLRVLNVSYWNFDENPQSDGQIMVFDAVAEPVLNIFEALYHQRFPLAKVHLIDLYQGSDEASMDDNNTSCFNWRLMVGGAIPSLHGYGMAIDINPIQNPFIQFPEETPGVATFSPAAGISYANRLENRPGKSSRKGMAEQVIDIFRAHGFSEWGGHWDDPIDYHHFQVPRALAEQLIALDPVAAEQKFKEHIQFLSRRS